MRISACVAAALVLSCYPVAAQAEGSAPPGFRLSHLNASSQPVTEGGITTFKILPGDCSDIPYRPGDDESDCNTGSTKSQIYHEQMIKIGQTVEYSFEVRVDPTFDYPGTFRRGLESLPFAPGAWDSDLRIASWEGPERKSFVFTMKLDAKRGITFQEHECAPPSTFGTWVKFTMKIRWEHNNKGWVHATCDDRTVWIEEGAASARQAVCHMFNECQPGIFPNSKSFNFVLGLAMSGRGEDWKQNGHDSKFVEINPDGLTIQMRNIKQTVGEAQLYGPTETALVNRLQDRLNELGCPVGKADGVVGKKTREQAVVCRSFEDALPSELNVATLPVFVERYERPEASTLPHGSPPQPAEFAIHIAGFPKLYPADPDHIYEFKSLIEQPVGAEMWPLHFVLIAEPNAKSNGFRSVSMLVEEELTAQEADAVGECGNNRVEHWPDGTSHIVLRFDPAIGGFKLRNLACLERVLSGQVETSVKFLAEHFDDMAATLLREGSTPAILDELVRSWIERVGEGEIVVGWM